MSSSVRRIVTSPTANGQATVVRDGTIHATTVALAPGYEFHLLWGDDGPLRIPAGDADATARAYFPPPGGCRFLLFTIPPASGAAAEGGAVAEGIDMAEMLAEMEAKLPGLAGQMESDGTGMHRSDTIDFLYVISGEAIAELGDGRSASLRAGDTLVQGGTRHAWRNPGSVPCRMVAVLVGAQR